MIFVQPQFCTKSAQLAAKEIGGQVAFADPLAEKCLDHLNQIAEQFQSALK